MILDKPCEVITFYSYTGGAGRSMALANVACLLAPHCPAGRGVLIVDWSLQSPSLHRYFLSKVETWSGEPNETESKLDRQSGLFDLFVEIEALVSKLGSQAASPDNTLKLLEPDRFVIPTDIPSVSLLKAGQLDDSFFGAVSSFQWAALHERAPWLIDSLADHWRQRYRFVLIDSTSGVNELSGLCAMMLPDKLVTVFTPSRQSLLGTVDVARLALDYRKSSGDPRPLAIFPLPSKIEADEAALRRDWRFGGESGDPLGYQARFEALFGEISPGISLDDYFTHVQIPYMPRYGYGDEVAAVEDSFRAASPLVRGYRKLAARLMGSKQPWDLFDAEGDLNAIEMDGRMMPLAEAEELCLRDIERYMAGADQLRAAASLEILASIKERLGRTTEAEAHYLEAIALCRAKQHDAGLASAAIGLARLERLLGRFEEARVYYLDASKIYRRTQSTALSSTLATLGDLDSQVGETEAAGEHYREAIEKYREDWDDAGVARTLMSLGDLDKRLGDSDSAQEHYREAAQLYHKERDVPGLARALTSLAEIQNREGKTEESEGNYCRAIELYRAELDGLRLAMALRGLADVRRGLKKIDLALAHYQEAVELFRQEGANLGLASALQSLADLEARSGRHADVKLHYEEAMVLYRKEDSNVGVANTLRSLGDLDRRLGRYETARSNYEQAMELYRVEKNNVGLANALQSLGDLEKRLGKIAEAEQRYTQAIAIFRGEGTSLGLANSLKSLGDVETEAGNLKVAQDHYEQAIELYRKGGRTLGLANALQSLGDLERSQKRFKEATTHYTTARDLYRLERHMTGLAYTCSELARVSHAVFDFAGSIEHLAEAIVAAKASNSQSVIDYVWGVQGEIRGKSAELAT